MTTIAHWWNGRIEPAERAEVIVRHNPSGSYEVQVTVAGRDALVEHLTRAKAEALAAELTGKPGWVQVEVQRVG